MEKSLKAFAPVLLGIGIILIVSGAGLALLYGRFAYQILYTPQDIPVLAYILGHIPASIGGSSFKGTIAGQAFELSLPETLTIYGFTLLIFIGFGVLIGIARCLSGSGVQIIKILWQKFPEDKQQD